VTAVYTCVTEKGIFPRDGRMSSRQVFMGMLRMKREKMRYNLP